MATNPHLVDDEYRWKRRMLIIYVNRDSFSMKLFETAMTGVVNKYEHTALFAMLGSTIVQSIGESNSPEDRTG
jgi:hypothetical protein